MSYRRYSKNRVRCVGVRLCKKTEDECFHVKPHQHSDACVGICRNYGYPECAEHENTGTAYRYKQ